MGAWKDAEEKASRAPAKKARSAKRAHPESSLQKAVISALGVWADLHGDERIKWVFHPPNGGRRVGADRYLLTADGVRSGIPDLIYPFPGSVPGYCGAYQELKSPTGVLRPTQKQFMKFAIENGAATHVAKTLCDALVFWRWYMGLDIQDSVLYNLAQSIGADVAVGQVGEVVLWQS